MGRTLQDDLASDAARMNADLAHFAIEVSYTPPRGHDSVPVDGIWRITTRPSFDTSRGREVTHTAELQTSTAVVIQEEGTIFVNDETWVVKSVGRPAFGQRIVYCHGTKRTYSSTGSGNKP